MAKIIIDDRDNDNAQAMALVAKVISGGMISGDKDCYCYMTAFTNGVMVAADKLKSGTHKFTVYREHE